MTFDNPTRADAIRIRNAIRQLEQFEAQQAEANRQARLVVVQTWWDTSSLKPIWWDDDPIPNTVTRTEALNVVVSIKNHSETNEDRIRFLGIKLQEADKKYRQVKKVNPHS